MKILVTGAYGLVGKSFQNLVATCKASFGDDNLYYYMSRSDCDLVDITSVKTMFMSISPDVVVHLASCVGGVYDNMSKNYDFLMNNAYINTNIVKCCKDFNVKLLINILSTCIFPDGSVSYPLTSDQLHDGLPHHSNIGYAYSKRLLHVESELLSTTGTKVVNLIPTNLYGPNDNYNLASSHVIPGLIHKTHIATETSSELKIYGTGAALRQFLFVDDLSKVIYNFIHDNNVWHNSISNSISCIVSPPESDEVSIRDLVSYITEVYGFTGKVVYDSSFSDGQLKKTTTDMELKRLYPLFQFTPLKSGLQQTIQFFKNNYGALRK